VEDGEDLEAGKLGDDRKGVIKAGYSYLYFVYFE
jgi:hypothetical protein